MGWEDPDLYNQPEKFGLKLIGSVSWTSEAYQFDITAVAQGVDSEGAVYYVFSDSGCSCPQPFDWYTSLDAVKFTTRDIMKVSAELQRLYAERLAENDESDQERAALKIADIASKLLFSA